MLLCNFKKQIGTITFIENGNFVTYPCYDSNALLCWVERGEDVDMLHGFFADEEHMKNCLGLTNGYDNLYTNVIELYINKQYNPWAKIVNAFLKAVDSATLVIIITGLEAH